VTASEREMSTPHTILMGYGTLYVLKWGTKNKLLEVERSGHVPQCPIVTDNSEE